jgi:hypothetical protein
MVISSPAWPGKPKVASIRDSSAALSAADLLTGVRFLKILPGFLKKPWRLEEASATLGRRFEQRAGRFLRAVKLLIIQNPDSPYLKLLDLAGCEFGDIARLVEENGVEGALERLYRAGVYLMVEEFKGRRPAVRSGKAIPVSPSLFLNPLARVHVSMKSSGSRSPGTAVFFDLNFIRDCALDTGLALQARDGGDWRKATWEVPGGGALFSLLEFSQFGRPPARWFSQLDPGRKDLHPRYRWSGRALRWGGRMAGVAMPEAQHIPLDNALPIAQWMAETLKKGETPYLLTYPSSALRVCRAALEGGIDLRGGQMTVAGEPCTVARLDAIRRTGAAVLPKYAIMETGPVGYGCLRPQRPDDIHLLTDLHAVIQTRGEDGPAGLPPNSILFSTLMTTAPLVLLNVSMGDQAVLERRSCGCPLERAGWATHIHSIRSCEKLTCGGMNFMDTDVIRVLDERLPARFGGGPTDYQILDEEKGDGRPELRLLIHPRLGPLNEQEVMRSFFQEISRCGGAAAVMGLAWQEGKLLKVERRPPLATPSGKILHLHVRPPAGGGAGREGPQTAEGKEESL